MKNDREIDFKGVKWEREDGLGAKAENLRLGVKEGCKKMNIIIIYEICMRAGWALLVSKKYHRVHNIIYRLPLHTLMPTFPLTFASIQFFARGRILGVAKPPCLATTRAGL